jgi:hypothetical protein
MNLYRMCREISVYLTGEARGLRNGNKRCIS